MDAAVAASFIKTGRHFHVKRRTKNDTEGFSRYKRCFHFTSDWLGALPGPMGIKIPTDGTSALKQTTGL